MASIVAYYRPRGMQGNYKVGVLLDLGQTERGKVFRGKEASEKFDEVYTNIFLDKPQKPKVYEYEKTSLYQVKRYEKTSLFKNEKRAIFLYVLPRFHYSSDHEVFRIEIRDTEIAGLQWNRYIAEHTSITGGKEEHDHITQLLEINLIEL